jgi:hypothetical protein
MAKDFAGDANAVRKASVNTIAKVCGTIRRDSATSDDLALVCALIPNLSHWSATNKQHLARVINAKSGADETHYLRLMQRHRLLRDALIKLGS